MNAPTLRHILIADPDVQSTRRLAAALRARGHQVLTVANGSKALEVAVLRAPEVVVYDAECPYIDAGTFADILRANPRTAGIPLLIMGREPQANRFRRGFREAYLQKPFNVDEVLSRLRVLLHRAEAADEVRREGDLEGQLTQLSLPDLLQMLGANRRSGTLHLRREVRGEGEAERGEILVSHGHVVDARIGEVRGEKALYRLLAWTRGTFLLEPGEVRVDPSIERTTEELLLEAMRQQDELALLEERLPSPDTALALAVDVAELPEGLHPITEEVLGLIETFHRCGDVIDHCRTPDLEVARALATVIERGLVKTVGVVGVEQGVALVSDDVAFALLGRRALRRTRGGIVVEIALLLRSARSLKEVVARLRPVQGWRPHPDLASRELPLGEVGTIHLGEAVRVVLIALPADDRYVPLYDLLAGSAQVSVLVAEEADTDATGLRAYVPLLRRRERLVVVVGDAPGLGEALEGHFIAASDLLAALARALEHLARRPGAAS